MCNIFLLSRSKSVSKIRKIHKKKKSAEIEKIITFLLKDALRNLLKYVECFRTLTYLNLDK